MSFRFNSEIKIGRLKVGENHPPVVVAELSGNHNGSLKRALKIVDAAARSGAQMLKLQTYTAETMTINLRKGEFFINDKKSLWKGSSLYDLYKKAYTPWEWHEAIFKRCKQLGVICFSTPFDETAVDFLEKLGAPAYKIASFENVDLPLIKRVAETGKPLIISTGMASQNEIAEAVVVVKKAKNKNLILLKCTSAYPAPDTYVNLKMIRELKKRFGCLIGLSDHTLGTSVSLASVGLGAVMIERHLTLRRSEGGVDSAFSIEPEELSRLVQESKRIHNSLGQVFYGPTPPEKGSLQFRRSLYIVEDLKKGATLTKKNVRRIRPGRGLSPKYFEEIIGKKIKRSVSKGTPLSWSFILRRQGS